MNIDRVGSFQDKGGYWESSPKSMNGSLISIESPLISQKQATIAQVICADWANKINIALRYVETVRINYKLEAHSFNNPNVFINSDTEWSIYFDTESEKESIVGVEFDGDRPFQLIIGD